MKQLHKQFQLNWFVLVNVRKPNWNLLIFWRFFSSPLFCLSFSADWWMVSQFGVQCSLCCHLISKNRNAVISSRIESLTVILNYLEQWTASPEPKTFVKSQDKYKRTANSANQKQFFSFHNVWVFFFFLFFCDAGYVKSLLMIRVGAKHTT